MTHGPETAYSVQGHVTHGPETAYSVSLRSLPLVTSCLSHEQRSNLSVIGLFEEEEKRKKKRKEKEKKKEERKKGGGGG